MDTNSNTSNEEFHAQAIQILFQKAVCLHREGEFDQAESIYKHLLKITGHNHEIALYSNLAVALKNQNKFEEAITCFGKAIELDPNCENTINNLANCYAAIGNNDKAEHYYKESLKMNPSAAKTYYNLGNLYESMQRYDEAIATYKQCLLNEDRFSRAQNNLAIVYESINRYEDAEYYYKEAITSDPEYFEAYKNLGFLYINQGRTEEAKSCFESAQSISTVDPVLNHQLDALAGKNVTSTPSEYIQNLFNPYAENFENHLINQLDYQVPYLTTAHLLPRMTHDEGLSHLDLGCGTGLVAEIFREKTKNVIGVDLSEEMLKVANQKNIYDELIVSDINAYLDHSERQFDLITCFDTLCYIGDLDQLFKAISKHLSKQGHFIFSTESCAGGRFQITKSGRFTHNNEYIVEILEKYFDKSDVFKILAPLRKEAESWIIGEMYLVTKQ